MPADLEPLARMVRGLSPQTIRLRFMGGVSREVALAEVRDEIASGAAHGDVFVAEDGAGELIGEAFAARLGEREAEIAFVVCDEWQHLGVGTLLLHALLDRLRSEGILTAYAETSWGNTAMLNLLHDSGLPVVEEIQGGGTIRARLDLRAA